MVYQARLFRLIIPAHPRPSSSDQIMRQSTSLGPILMASAAAQLPGWNVEVIDENNCARRHWPPQTNNGRLDHEILQQRCPAAIVGFYAGLSSTIPRVYELAKLYRQAGAFTVAGGYHARALPEDLIHHGLDAVAMSIANSEKIIAELLKQYDLFLTHCPVPPYLSEWDKYQEALTDQPPNHLAQWIEWRNEYLAAVPGLMWRKDDARTYSIIITNPIGPLEATETDRCPKQLLPDFGLLHYARLKVFPIQWRRGCHRRCESCVVREKPNSARAEDLLATVKHCFENFQATRFFIVDDCFGGNLNLANERTELIEALRLLVDYQKEISRRLKFTVQIGLNTIEDNEVTELMRQAGITNVCISYQVLLSEKMKVTRREYLMLYRTKKWRQAGFSVQAMYIFNYPEETGSIAELERFQPLSHRVKKVMKFVQEEMPRLKQDRGLSVKKQVVAIGKWFRKAGVNSLRVSLAVPLPGSDLRKRLEQEKRLLPFKENGWEYYDGQFPLYQPEDCSPEELLEGLQAVQNGFAGWIRFLRPSFYRRRPPTEFLAKLKRARESAH
ncbi:MAG: hypothetical protein WC517_02875 [Patescibacteria group bacterium]